MLEEKEKGESRSIVRQLFESSKKEPHVTHVFTKIALMSYIDDLDRTSKKHDKFYIERNSEAAEKQRGDIIKAIKKEAQAPLRNLFEHIEMGYRTYPELNYMPWMTRLNVNLARFTNSIKTRDTYNKKRAQKAKEDKEAALAPKPDTKMQLKIENEK